MGQLYQGPRLPSSEQRKCFIAMPPSLIWELLIKYTNFCNFQITQIPILFFLSIRITYMQGFLFCFVLLFQLRIISKPRIRGEGKSTVFSYSIQIKSDQLTLHIRYVPRRPTKLRLWSSCSDTHQHSSPKLYLTFN